jgi:hypothetical protein
MRVQGSCLHFRCIVCHHYAYNCLGGSGRAPRAPRDAADVGLPQMARAVNSS